jgi:hypothetical protein
MACPNDINQIAKGLSDAQRESLLGVDPSDVSEALYQPFKGCAAGIFQIAPGWKRLELTSFGRALRTQLLVSKGLPND